ncbi:IseA DL-endopeptidase inhibitor family protein [Bacillus atrophaeus]|uniref:IseA DL-endopeptidase inhibitor family protein n=1 Tax=Bacillus atrophaeus TaxID=1452 RepID=UPI003529849D
MKKLILFLITASLFLSVGTASAAKNTSNDLTQKQALQLALQAREHFWNTMSGHNPKAKNSTCTNKTFEYQNLQYIYMCSEFDTKAKVVHYLTPVFTKEAITNGLKDYHFTVYKGKFAVPIGDGDNLLNWEKASSKLVSKKGSVRTYEFTVPLLDGSPAVKRKVTYVKENNKWKINQFDAVI